MTKDVEFLGDTLKRIRGLPYHARQNVGYQIDRVQNGEQPDDFKPMPSVGHGVEEIRVWDSAGTYRVIYAARRPEAVYVLHVFQKTSQHTSQHDIDLAKKRFAEIPR